jgi:alpha-L-fucosidase
MRVISRYTGQALDVAGGSVDDGAAILQWPVHGGNNQAWTLEPAGDGYMRLVVRHSGKAMDVEAGSIADGARVLRWAPHNGANQQWRLRPVE